MNFKQFQTYLDSLPKKIETALANSNEHIVWQYLSRLRQFTPIGEARKNRPSGVLHNKWQHQTFWNQHNAETLFENTAESKNGFRYGHSIEFGSTPGSLPWKSVGKRTVMFSGRIYSSQAPGGMTQHIDDNEVLISAKYLGDELIEAFR